MERKGLNSIHGIIATLLAVLFLLFGGYIVVPLFGENGGLYAGVFIALIGVIFTVLTKTRAKEVFPFRLPPIKQFFGSIFMYIGLMMFSASISVITSKLFNPDVRNDEIDAMLLKMSPLSAILIIAVLPALCEEFFCRGFLVRCFSHIKNEKIIILITALIFGVMHLDPYSFFPTSLMGVLLCYIALKTKSLLIPMFLHFANNAFSVVMTFLSAPSSAELTNEVASISQIPLLPSLGMAILYIGISVLPFYIGYRLFKGKKVFCGTIFIAIALSVSLLAVGTTTFLVTSYDKYDEINEELIIPNGETTEIDIPLEQGSYLINVSVSCATKVNVYIKCADKVVTSLNGYNEALLSTAVDYVGRGCCLVIEVMGDSDGSTIEAEYEITVFKRNY